MLNRAALIVRPAAPFLAWMAGLDDSGILPEPDGEQTVYLIPEVNDDRDVERKLKLVYKSVFENELFGWHTVEADWPRNRTYAMFKRWFRIEVHSIVEDLCVGPIVDDDDL